jgi:hypothetical protein
MSEDIIDVMTTWGPGMTSQGTSETTLIDVLPEVAPGIVEVSLDDSVLELERETATIEVLTPAEPGTGLPTWSELVLRWDSQPVKLGQIAAGSVYSYTLQGVTRYRLVPSPYVMAQDGFYGSYVNGVLMGLITSRV